jgi:hypothetical protein
MADWIRASVEAILCFVGVEFVRVCVFDLIGESV